MVVVGLPLPREHSRAEHPEGGVRTVVVVLGSPVGDEHLGPEDGVELLDGQGSSRMREE